MNLYHILIKHLEKELARINGLGELESKALSEKLIIEKKIAQLDLVNQKFIKQQKEDSTKK